MRNFELKPTFEKIKYTLIHDSLGRVPYIKRFAKLLDSIEFNTSIALNGNWGTGKTFFVKQLMLYLIVQNQYIRESYTNEELSKINYEELKNIVNSDEIKNLFIPVYYDAWKNDNATDPILSIINETIKSICDFGKLEDQRNVKKCVSEIVKTVVGSGKLKMKLTPDSANPGSYISGEIDGEKLANIFDSFKYLKRRNLLRSFNAEDELRAKIRKLFQNYLAEKGNKFVIFIDELDRCRPSYAIRLLEKIKHYFDIDNIIFVFSINQKELQNTVRKFYGNDFDGYRYLSKFFDLSVSLPDIDMDEFVAYLYSPINKFRNLDTIQHIIKEFNFSMRDVCRFLTLYNISINDFSSINNNKIETSKLEGYKFCFEYIIPIAIALFIAKPDDFEEFLSGNKKNYLHDFIRNNNSYFREIRSTLNNSVSARITDNGILDYIYNKLFKSDYDGSQYDNFFNITFYVDFNMGKKVKEIVTLLSEFSDYKN